MRRNRVFTKEFWREKDKRDHATYELAFGFLVTIVSFVLAMHFKLGDSLYIVSVSAAIGFSSMSLIGWIKELHDGEGNGTKDIEDIDADYIGGSIGVFAGTVTNIFFLLLAGG